MELQTVMRRPQKLRIAISGMAGSGKTMSSLLLAYGLSNNWNKIALIDTEQDSASLYASLGSFSTLSLHAPYSPSCYYEALDLCLDSGKEVIIIDSLSPEWAGEGGVAEHLHQEDYQDVLREHRCLLSLISSCNAHIICTLRVKQKLVAIPKDNTNNTISPLTLIELPIQQEGIAYPFTTVIRLDRKHKVHIEKDRTGMLSSKAPFVISEEVGLWLKRWCEAGTPEGTNRITASSAIDLNDATDHPIHRA